MNTLAPRDPSASTAASLGALNAAFLAGILEGRDLLTCGRMGAIAGAMATENAGDTEGYPTRQQMDARLTNTDTVFR